METTDAAEWQALLAFTALEPWGPRAEERRAGEVAAAVGGVLGARVRPADYFPSLAPTAAELAAARSARWLALCPAAAAGGDRGG